MVRTRSEDSPASHESVAVIEAMHDTIVDVMREMNRAAGKLSDSEPREESAMDKAKASVMERVGEQVVSAFGLRVTSLIGVLEDWLRRFLKLGPQPLVQDVQPGRDKDDA